MKELVHFDALAAWPPSCGWFDMSSRSRNAATSRVQRRRCTIRSRRRTRRRAAAPQQQSGDSAREQQRPAEDEQIVQQRDGVRHQHARVGRPCPRYGVQRELHGGKGKSDAKGGRSGQGCIKSS
jgi:hypothetical protein